MTWQEPIVGVIVGLAVVSLYRHLRDLIGSAAPDAQASCHGCDDCDTEPDQITLDERPTMPLAPPGAHIH